MKNNSSVKLKLLYLMKILFEKTDEIHPLTVYISGSHGANEVMTWVGGATRDVLHPSVQVGQYQMYLQDTHTAFYEGDNPVHLNSCAYLHNYHYYSDDVIFEEKFKESYSITPCSRRIM